MEEGGKAYFILRVKGMEGFCFFVFSFLFGYYFVLGFIL